MKALLGWASLLLLSSFLRLFFSNISIQITEFFYFSYLYLPICMFNFLLSILLSHLITFLLVIQSSKTKICISIYFNETDILMNIKNMSIYQRLSGNSLHLLLIQFHKILKIIRPVKPFWHINFIKVVTKLFLFLKTFNLKKWDIFLESNNIKKNSLITNK